MSKVVSLAEYRNKKSARVLEMEEAYRNFYLPEVKEEEKVVRFSLIEQISEEEAMEAIGTGLSQETLDKLLAELEEEGVDTKDINVIKPDPDCPY